jgi:xanthine/CO dehydrogenase XdhC/CoxF family maturation factor
MLLSALEEGAREARLVAVVRVLNSSGSSTITAAVRPSDSLPGVGDEQITQRVSAALDEMIRQGTEVDLLEASDAEGNPIRVVVELVRDKLHVVIFGAGHVGHAVALISAILGYRVTVVDDREEFASRKRLCDLAINLMVGDYDTVSRKVELSSNTAVVIVTRGHQYDEVCLRSVIRSEAGYIGMIGSKRRVLAVFDRLNHQGFTREELSKVHAPIGLRIGGRSPQEIAVAIVAEIIGNMNNSEPDSR